MRKLGLILALWGVMALSASAATVTVGGSGFASLKAALASLTTTTANTVIIEAGTYQEVAPVQYKGTDLVIAAAADAAVTLTTTYATSASLVLQIFAPTNVTIRGASPTNQLHLAGQVSGSGCLELNYAGPTKLLENVKLTHLSTPGGGIFVFQGPATFNNSFFSNLNTGWNNGLLINGGIGGGADDIVFNNCVYEATQEGLHVYTPGAGGAGPANITFNNTTFRCKGGNFGITPFLFRTGPLTVTFNRCTLDGWVHAITYTGWLGAPDPANHWIFNSPTFLNNVLYTVNFEQPFTITVKGLPGEKVDATSGAGGGAFASVPMGILNVEDVITNRGIVTSTTDMNTTPVVTLSRVEFTTGTAIQNVAAGGTGSLTVNATNCIFAMNKNGTIVTNKTTADTINLTHCTFYRSLAASSYRMMIADASDTLNADYCIFDGANMDQLGNIALNGTLNIVNSAATSDFTSEPGDTIYDNPNVDATGHIVMESIAGGAAVGSSTTIDVDGNSRPLPTGSAPDIGADENFAVPVELSEFSLE